MFCWCFIIFVQVFQHVFVDFVITFFQLNASKAQNIPIKRCFFSLPRVFFFVRKARLILESSAARIFREIPASYGEVDLPPEAISDVVLRTPEFQNRIEIKIYTPWKFNSSPLKISHHKRKTIIFQGSMLNFVGVTKAHHIPCSHPRLPPTKTLHQACRFGPQSQTLETNSYVSKYDLWLCQDVWGANLEPWSWQQQIVNSCGWWWAFPCFKHTRLRSMSWSTKKQFARMHRVVEGWC